MKAPLRLHLLVSLLFLVSMVLTLYGLISQGRKDIAREIGASIHVAEQMIEAADYAPERLGPLLNGTTRHIRFYLNSAPQSDPETLADSDIPAWFYQLIWQQSHIFSRPWRYPLDNGQTLYVVAAPADEIDEVWESAWLLAMLFVGAALLSNIAVWIAVRQGQQPIQQMLKELECKPSHPFSTGLERYPQPEARRLAGHFNRMAEALQREQSDKRQLSRQLMALQEKERTRLAHLLHDDFGQYLTGIRAQAFMIDKVSGQPELVATTAKQIIQHCDAMQGGFRHLIRDLHPVILSKLGLTEALQSLADQWQEASGISLRLTISDGLPELNTEHSSHIYRLVQEALHNIRRHADATVAEVMLCRSAEQLTLRVSDDGNGLSPDAEPGIGMHSMHERARYLGGALKLDSVAGGGTRISLNISLEVL
ncbi:sensor histidine kinase [Marinobacterium jannaschii]|uniref:sensor histidine kinase n=1 Tax=Marinobacterium jannaschii TaxID=64970 RepID=UPI0004884A63|nr:sensor histidine kinase [Marinobacterium jannaschii]